MATQTDPVVKKVLTEVAQFNVKQKKKTEAWEENLRQLAADYQDKTQAKDVAKQAVSAVSDLTHLNELIVLTQEQIKKIAANTLKPGSKKPIDEIGVLDYIWDLPGDRSWSSKQKEPFRGKALDYYRGRKVRHVWGTGQLVKIKNKSKEEWYGIRVVLTCIQCKKNKMTVYALPGCHVGAFCYIYDRSKKYLADLRNQSLVCDKCG